MATPQLAEPTRIFSRLGIKRRPLRRPRPDRDLRRCEWADSCELLQDFPNAVDIDAAEAPAVDLHGRRQGAQTQAADRAERETPRGVGLAGPDARASFSSRSRKARDPRE